MASDKQRLLIAHYIARNSDEHRVFGQIWETIKPSREGIDDREMVLAEKITPLSNAQADCIIKAYIVGKKGYHILQARNIINGLHLI